MWVINVGVDILLRSRMIGLKMVILNEFITALCGRDFYGIQLTFCPHSNKSNQLIFSNL